MCKAYIILWGWYLKFWLETFLLSGEITQFAVFVPKLSLDLTVLCRICKQRLIYMLVMIGVLFFFSFSDSGVWQSCCSVGKWEFTIQSHVAGIRTPKRIKTRVKAATRSQLWFKLKLLWLKCRIAHMHKHKRAYMHRLIAVASILPQRWSFRLQCLTITDFLIQRHWSHFRRQAIPHFANKLANLLLLQCHKNDCQRAKEGLQDICDSTLYFM